VLFTKKKDLDALISGNMIAAEIVNAQAINGNKPSLALKENRNNFVADADHSINSKIDLLRKQNDFLFICELCNKKKRNYDRSVKL
jgi:hypothetical protein